MHRRQRSALLQLLTALMCCQLCAHGSESTGAAESPEESAEAQGLAWEFAGSVAHYLELEYVLSLNIPVVVNVVFVGFDRNGNLAIDLPAEKLERWFGALDTSNPFTASDLSRAAVRFHYSLNVVKVSPNVTDVVDAILAKAMRPDNPLEMNAAPGAETPFMQIEAAVMQEVLDSLANFLELDDAYTVFILNPRRASHGRMYGYRSGLSQAEKSILYSDDHFRSTYTYGQPIKKDSTKKGPTSFRAKEDADDDDDDGDDDEVRWGGLFCGMRFAS